MAGPAQAEATAPAVLDAGPCGRRAEPKRGLLTPALPAVNAAWFSSGGGSSVTSLKKTFQVFLCFMCKMWFVFKFVSV